ncbi:MAG: multiheme c-type cytochrome [Armatimonadota bacterium]
MTSENRNTVIVESGNLSNMPDRVGLIASVLKGLGYDAVGVGETDVRTCGEEFFKKTAENKLTVLDAAPQAHPSTVPYLIKNVGGVRVGIISFGFVPPSPDRNVYTLRKALYGAYKTAREQSDILIVLDQANLVDKEWVERNENRLGVPDVVIGGAMRQYPEQGQVIGRTRIVPTSIQGKHVGVVDVELSPGREPVFTVQKIPLEQDVAEDAAIAARVKEFMSRIAQPPTYTPPQPGGPGQKSTVVGARKPYYHPQLCASCHLKEYQDWETTKHAHAVATLSKEQRLIPECLKCHSEMYRTLERISNVPEEAAGVECATCHIGSLPHGLERKNVTTRVKVDPKICLECHDKQWSPNYDEKTYMSRISHIGASSPAASGSAGTASPSVPPTSAPPAENPAGPPPAREKPPVPPPPPPILPNAKGSGSG